MRENTGAAGSGGLDSGAALLSETDVIIAFLRAKAVKSAGRKQRGSQRLADGKRLLQGMRKAHRLIFEYALLFAAAFFAVDEIMKLDARFFPLFFSAVPLCLIFSSMFRSSLFQMLKNFRINRRNALYG